ncbi:MAG: ATP-dependent DNA helicase RecG [Burkholderiales bacterium]|nr:ATP-dependent DNA helicase RecG [Burkholderiales bacterium]
MLQLLEPILNVRSVILNRLSNIGISNYWDLLLHIPLRYEDLTTVYPIVQTNIGSQVLVEGAVISCEIIHKRTKQLQVQLTDSTQIITLIFFHFYPNYASQYSLGKRLRVYGEIKADFLGNKIIIHPRVQTVTEQIILPNTFSPIYSTTKGLNQPSLIKLIEEALFILEQTDSLPDKVMADLPTFYQAIFTLHKLTPEQFKSGAHKKALMRLKLDELIAQQLILYNAYGHKHTKPAIALKPLATYTKRLLDNLGFKLTPSQIKVLGEIYTDLTVPIQMNRLLQGDVGSGKTIVAILSMLVAVENNRQACIIAPTEILAKQHFLKIQALLENLNIIVVWLSGSLTAKEKQHVYDKINSGSAQIIVGTHAVFQKDVVFNNLALIVIDEQHRFGVDQRLLLQSKGNNPHQLMMSATPIPRTLAMSYYADLDISTIDELPQGRAPVKTLLINNNRRYEVIKFVQSSCENGAQVYWVCPLIDESENLDLETAVNTFNELAHELGLIKVGLLHGKMKIDEKSRVIEDFNNGQLKVLVATTVVEVGVDVPNASIMVIEHSERMGLSQLHQLRGRVGRGNVESQCILLYQNPLGEVAKQRLKVIYENNDGFIIANEDLKIRGPGEILGSKQSGLPNLRFANLETDLELLKLAKVIAKNMINDQPDMAKLYTKLWFSNHEHFLGA